MLTALPAPVSRRRMVRSAAAALLLGAVLAFVPAGAAGAAPGDAAASGVRADLLVGDGISPSVALAGSLGAVSAPPDQSASLAGQSLVLPAKASVSADVVDTSASSGAGGSHASSVVRGATIDLPELRALGAGFILATGDMAVSTAADCPTGGTPTATADPVGSVSAGGSTVTFDADGRAVVAIDAGGTAAGTVTIQLRTTTTTTTTAAAAALVVDLDIDLPGVVVATGTVTIAEATCEAPTAPVPTASGIAPSHGPDTGGTTVTLTGTGFVPGATTVDVNGVTIAASAVTVAGDGNSLTFVTPANPSGVVEVTATTAGGTTGPRSYTYDPTTTATSITPTHGPTAGGTEVTMTGTGFVDGNTSVNIGGTLIAANEVTVSLDGTTLSFVTPAHAGGPVNVTATTNGATTGPRTYTYDVVPTAAGLSPIAGPATGGTTVTMTGTGFVAGGTTVSIATGATTVTIPATDVTVGAGGTSLTFTTPAHAVGLVGVTAETDGGTTDPLTYTFEPAPTVAPTASAIDPPAGPDTGGTTVTVTGTGFVPDGTTIAIGGITVPAGDVTVSGTGTSLTFVAPAHAAGPVGVTATTDGGTTAPLAYTYDHSSTATSITPAEGSADGGTTVTITGTGFVAGDTTVTIDGATIAAAGVTVAVDGLSLSFATPAHPVPGPVEVTAATSGATTDPLTFTYVPPEAVPVIPVAATIDPDRGPTTGGTTVTITGSGFVPGATTVTIDGATVPAGAVAVAPGGTSLRFSAPAHRAGAVEVTVTTDAGTTEPLAYTYVAPPTAVATSPATGPTTAGTVVTVSGTGFVPGATTVTIGGVTIPASDVTVATDGTSLTFIAPAHVAGTVAVSVTTPDGTVYAPPFTYVLSEAVAADQPRTDGSDGTGDGMGTAGDGDGSTLPRTGAELSTPSLLGLALVAAGSLLLTARRRLARR